MRVLNMIFAFINIFFGAFVAYKVYNWFYTEVGFDLPALTYLHIFAISCIFSAIVSNKNLSLQVGEIHTKITEEKHHEQIAITLLYTFELLVFWLLKIILY